MTTSKFRKTFEELDKKIGYTEEKKAFLDAFFIKPLEFMEKIKQSLDKEEFEKLLHSILNSFTHEFLNLDVIPIENPKHRTSDAVVKLDKGEIYLRNNYNESFAALLGPKVAMRSLLNKNFQIQKETVIGGDMPQKIIFEMEFLLFSVNKYILEILPKAKQLSSEFYINVLILIKLYFVETNFDTLLQVFKEINHNGISTISGVLKFLILQYNKALAPNKKINYFNSFVFDGYGFHLSKKTSDKICRKMKIIFQDKLRIIASEEVEPMKVAQIIMDKRKYSLRQIALYYYYLGKPIQNSFAAEPIAKNYGYISKTSKQDLYEAYFKYIEERDFLKSSDNKRSNNFKIENYIKVFELLIEEPKILEKAKKDSKLLKTAIEKTNYIPSKIGLL
jgi:hypothetical protein